MDELAALQKTNPQAFAAVILSVRQYRQKYAAECGKARVASQFKAGKTGNATGRKGKEQVNLKPDSPVPVRDLQKMNGNSTAGKIAEASGASRSVVDELAALQKTNPQAFAAVILSVRQYRQKYAAECGKARVASQFKAGKTGNATGRKGKEQVNLKSGSPVPVRDLQKMHANSTAGKIAEASGASRSVVDELAALQKTNPQAFAAVAAGKAKLKDHRHIHSASCLGQLSDIFQT